MRLTAAEVAALTGGEVEGDPRVELEGAEVDSRLIDPGELFVALAGARCDGHDHVAAALTSAHGALVSRSAELAPPGEGRALIRVADPLAAYHRLARRMRARQQWKVVAITGSVAKTTTKDFVAALLEPDHRVGATEGNRNSTLGLPAQLLRQPSELEVFVAEAGMSRAGELDLLGGILRPEILLYTRIAPAHTEFFADIDGVVAAKAELLGHLQPDGVLIVNADDRHQQGFAQLTTARVLTYGGADSAVRLENCQDLGLRGSRFELVIGDDRALVELDLPGVHQAENLVAASAAASVLGVEAGAVSERAAGLQAAPRRGRLHQLDDGVVVVDDSYNASPVAMQRLLDLLAAAPGRRVAVLGEMYELGESAALAHRRVGELAAEACDVLVAVGGELARVMAASAGAAGMNGNGVMHVEDDERATEVLRSMLRADDVVLVKGSRGVGLDRTVDALTGNGGQLMLYRLLYPLSDTFIGFNVFRYITFRTGLALATAFFISLLLGPWLLERLRALQIRQAIREEGPEHHQAKAGTPTMGGVLIIASVTLSTLAWADLENLYVWTVLLVTLGFAAVGFADDWIKVRYRRNLGLTTRQKLFLQTLVGLAGGLAARWVAQPAPHAGALALPFLKDVLVPLGVLYLPFVVVVLIGTSNAVNLTDGLDGLAVGAMVITASTYTLFVYVAGHARIAEYLRIVPVSTAGEVSIFTGAIVGAGLGFLWFNCHPAQVFMGDVGSLALGGGIGMVAVVAKQELLLALVGGLFVIEALSVLIQVVSFKLRGKRVFRMAPLHHHFELLGWDETQVVVRFWIISLVFALAGLATLKLR